MEKFSKWRDASTGIQPFLPPRPVASESMARRAANVVKYWTLGPIVAALRLVLAAIVMAWLIVVGTVGSQLRGDRAAVQIPGALVRRGFLRYTHALGGRVLLALLGFWWIPTSWASIRRGRLTPPLPSRMADETPAGLPGSGLGSGDLILANLTSYVDVLYLAFRFAPQFTEIVRVRQPGNAAPLYRLRPVSLWRALQTVTRAPALDVPTADATYTVDALLAWAAARGRGPVVVFPEATTSNGRCVLGFTPILAGWTPKTQKCMIVGLRYSYEDYSPTYTAGSLPGHLFGLACQASNALEVRYVAPAEAAVLLEGEPDFQSHVATVLAQVLRSRRARLGVDDKSAFLDYFDRMRSGYRASKND